MGFASFFVEKVENKGKTSDVLTNITKKYRIKPR